MTLLLPRSEVLCTALKRPSAMDSCAGLVALICSYVELHMWPRLQIWPVTIIYGAAARVLQRNL